MVCVAGFGMIGLFGGTFNPIHFGHLRSAVELCDQLELRQLHLMPCAQPPHRELPSVSARDRLKMIESAIVGEQRFIADDRELLREGPSYTIDTVESLHKEFNNDPICMMLGMDSFLLLNTWQQWEKITDYAHIVIMHRPGWRIDDDKNNLPEDLRRFLEKRLVNDINQLCHAPIGSIATHSVTSLDISSSHIRSLVESGKSPRYLLPDSVWELIQKQNFYTT